MLYMPLLVHCFDGYKMLIPMIYAKLLVEFFEILLNEVRACT